MAALACTSPDLSSVLNGTDDRLARLATRRHARRSGIQFYSADYEDALQNARLALIRAARTYRPDGGAGWVGYALMVCRNYLLEVEPGRVRRGMRFAPVDSPPAYDPDPAVWADRAAGREGDPADLAAERDERDARVRRLLPALRALRPVARLCVRLHFLEGLNTREIAEAIGVTRSAADNAIALAVARLRDALGVVADSAPLARTRAVWSRRDDDQAIDMKRAGAGCCLIGRQLGRSEKSVSTRLLALRAAGRL
jgi:RNA polymerase sigma factor (sigma-70 family)